MSEESPSDKQHEPSQKRLDDARRKGEVLRAADLNVALAYGGLLLACYGFGGPALARLLEEMILFWEDGLVRGGFGRETFDALTGQAVTTLTIMVGLPAGLILLTLTGLRLITFAPSKLAPKASRVSILENAKNKFGRSGLFEFFKSFTKLMLYSICLSLYLSAHLEDLAQVLALSAYTVTILLLRMGLEFLFIGFLIALIIGAVDYVWQHMEFLRKHRMSHKEVRDEHKEAEGDPHMKAQRQRRAQELTQQQLAARVPEADVVIVNPEHYAVALAWSRQPGEVPHCVAKGVDGIAQRIKEIAAEAHVPIHRDPPTARALHASVDIDETIEPEHFRAVAAAIRFADFVKSKQRSWR